MCALLAVGLRLVLPVAARLPGHLAAHPGPRDGVRVAHDGCGVGRGARHLRRRAVPARQLAAGRLPVGAGLRRSADDGRPGARRQQRGRARRRLPRRRARTRMLSARRYSFTV